MNRSKVEILKEEIVLPEVVVAAAEDAFDKILREASMEKVEKMEVACMKSRKPKFKKRWVALVAVAALVVGTLSVGAATDFQWFKPVEENLRQEVITDEEKAVIEKYSLGNKIGQSIEQNGVTVTAEEYICDRHMVYAIFSVDGVSALKGEEWLEFTEFDISVGSSLGSVGGNYLGWDEETGKHFYSFTSTNFSQNDIAGRYVNVTLNGLQHLTPIPESVLEDGTWTEYDNVKNAYDGTFTFRWQLENSAAIKSYSLEGVDLSETGITLQSISISPLSALVEANYSLDVYDEIKDTWENDREENGELDNYEFWSGFCGFKMKDGSIVESLGIITLTGNVGTDKTTHENIIDVDQIEALLFVNPLKYTIYDRPTIEEQEKIEIPIADLKVVE